MLSLGRRRDGGPDATATLYAGVVERSRQIELYTTMGAPDTAEGRFELLTAHVIVAVERLNREGETGRSLGQALFDLYVRNLDSALREMGVGDLAVAKRMKTLGKIFYGRANAMTAAFASDDPADLEGLMARTVLVDQPHVDPAPLAAYLTRERARLADIALDDLTGGGPG